MEYKVNSDLKFGDKIFVVELFHEEEDGGLVTDPYVYEEFIEAITFREDGSVSYHTEPHFRTLEAAKKFCEKQMYDEGLKCCAIEDCLFEWVEGTRSEVINFETGEKADLKTWNLVSMTEVKQ